MPDNRTKLSNGFDSNNGMNDGTSSSRLDALERHLNAGFSGIP